MRFASHRDVARAIERGVRKAGLPVAYSAGFSPHPRISYSGGAPTGAASEAEYLELALTSRCEADDVRRRLDVALPDGIDVIEVAEAAGKAGQAQLEASEWEILWAGVPADAADSAVRKFLAAPSVEVKRLTSKGTRTLDARSAVLSLVTQKGPTDGCAILRMIVRQLTPAVRPDDILAALRQLSSLEPAPPPMVTRLWQGPLSALTAAQTGAQPGMTAACEMTGPEQPEHRSAGMAPSAASDAEVRDAAPPRQAAADPGVARHVQDLPGPLPQRPDADPGREELLPSSTTDKAMQLRAESAVTAPARTLRANDQLLRGTLGQHAGLRAREPYGRDCPDARDRAAESTVRTK
jgi:radical SAM-linked protein